MPAPSKGHLLALAVAGTACSVAFLSPVTIHSAQAGLQWQTGAGFEAAEISGSREDLIGPHQAGFVEVPSGVTGVTFTNALSNQQIIQNNNFMNGSGVAAGDFDGDGRCDFYFCAITGANALYRNVGNWKFEDVTAKAGLGLPGAHSTGATFADIDGDGDLDLLVTTLGRGVLSFTNEGGRFQNTTQASGLGSDTGATSMALADVDGDGDLDLYVANYGAIPIIRSGGQARIKRENGEWVVVGPYAKRLRYINGDLKEVGEPDTLYLNDGRGGFKPVPWNSEFFLDEDGTPMPAPWDFGLTIQMRDMNGDGAPDIYVCNDFETVDRIWINNGHGRFRALTTTAMRKQSFSSMGVDFADVDRDGDMDLFVVDMLGREHSLRMRQIFSKPLAQWMPGEIEIRPEEARNTFFLNRGDGTYAEIANYAGLAATDWSWHPAFMDIDLDGYEDLLMVNGMPFDILDRDTLDMIRAFGRVTPEQSRTNLLLFPPLRTPNIAFRNGGDLKFHDAGAAWGFDSRRISHGMALADLDNDGDLDVAINCLNDAPLLYRNETTAPRLAVRLRGRKPNTQGIGATVRLLNGPVRVQSQEMISGGRYLSSDDPLRVFAAGGLGDEGARIEVQWRSGKRSVIDDARANCIYVIAEPEESQGLAAPGDVAEKPVAPGDPIPPLFKDVSHLLSHAHRDEIYNDYARQPLLMKQLSQLGPGAGWIDLDGDGQDELVIGTGRGGALGVLRKTASGKFEPMEDADWTAPDDTTGLASWVSPDGAPSLLVGVAQYESVDMNRSAVFRLGLNANTGKPQVTEAREAQGRQTNPGPLAVSDFDGDGDLDLFVGGRLIPGAYPAAASSFILRQNSGELILDEPNSRLLENIGMVSGAVWSDLNNDGFPELILACEWGPLRVFQNDNGQLTPWDFPVTIRTQSDSSVERSVSLGQLTGWWHGVNTGDFDGDGRLDIIAANWGLNDGYRASLDHPLQLYFGNIGGSGMVDLIEAYYAPELNADVPLRSLASLRQAFPSLAEHFSTHRAFSSAAMSEVLEVLPSRPDRVFATTLASMLFLNRESHFIATPLPAEAQFAPAFSVNIGDADGDGREDVFLSQNFFAMRLEWPRLDGGQGLWLRGDGMGGLHPIASGEAGIQIHGEQRGAALADFNEDGRVDLVVAQNAAATKLFENVGAKPGLRVRVKGPPGNPSGIGAVIRLKFGDRLGSAREIHCGAGYWSQDSVVQVMGCPEPPTAARVLWPGGKTFSVPIPEGVRELVVDINRLR